MVASNAFDPDRHWSKYHLFGWGIPAVFSTFTLTHYQFLVAAGHSSQYALEAVINEMEIAIEVTDGVAVLVIVITTFLITKRLSWGLPLSKKSRKRVAWQQMCFAVGFTLGDVTLIGLMISENCCETPYSTILMARMCQVFYDGAVWIMVMQVGMRLGLCSARPNFSLATSSTDAAEQP